MNLLKNPCKCEMRQAFNAKHANVLQFTFIRAIVWREHKRYQKFNEWATARKKTTTNTKVKWNTTTYNRITNTPAEKKTLILNYISFGVTMLILLLSLSVTMNFSSTSSLSPLLLFRFSLHFAPMCYADVLQSASN